MNGLYEDAARSMLNIRPTVVSSLRSKHSLRQDILHSLSDVNPGLAMLARA